MSEMAADPVLLLLNGAPGSGKSTVAARLVAQRPLALALEIDALKHSLGGWDRDLQASGLQARRLAFALARRHLEDGHDVVIGQYLARPAFAQQLEDLAAHSGARFVEAVLLLDAEALAQRLTARRHAPDRPEQAANDRFVGPEDAPALVASIDQVLTAQPGSRRIDAARPIDRIVDELSALLTPTLEPGPPGEDAT